MTPPRGVGALAPGLAMLVLVHCVAGAQPVARTSRVGILSPAPPGDLPTVETFRRSLRELGYVEGRNLLLDYRYADWRLDRLPALAAELVRLQPDAIFTHTTPGVLAARGATTTIPIVVGPAGVETLLERGLVASLARPGGNVTGLVLISRELEPKRLQLLKEVAPAVSRVAVLVDPGNPAWRRYPVDFEPAGRALGLELRRVEARGPDTLD